MMYILNVYLDEHAQPVGGGGPHADAKLAAHLWFKNVQDTPGGAEWVPVADPVTVSMANDTIGFTLADVYGELSNQAVYKITFSASSGPGSPLDPTITSQLADGSYGWSKGRNPIVGLKNPTDYVTTSPLFSLANTGTGFEFVVEVDDGSTVEYYLDPKMIVDP